MGDDDLAAAERRLAYWEAVFEAMSEEGLIANQQQHDSLYWARVAVAARRKLRAQQEAP